jgi:hypothetical protein
VQSVAGAAVITAVGATVGPAGTGIWFPAVVGDTVGFTAGGVTKPKRHTKRSQRNYIDKTFGSTKILLVTRMLRMYPWADGLASSDTSSFAVPADPSESPFRVVI